MKWGFIRTRSDVKDVKIDLTRLISSGVVIENVIIADDPSIVLDKITEEDELLVVMIADLGKSLQGVFAFIEKLNDCNATLNSLNDDDYWLIKQMKYPGYKNAVKNMNRLNYQIISIRTKKGLMKAKANGKKLGRPWDK